MSSNSIQAGEAFVELQVRYDEFQKGLTNIGTKLDDFGGKFQQNIDTLQAGFGEISGKLGGLGDIISATGVGFQGLSMSIGSITLFQEAWNLSLNACPIFRIIGALTAASAVVGAIAVAVSNSNDELAENAEKLEEVRIKNDKLRESAQTSIGVLDRLTMKRTLDTKETIIYARELENLREKCIELGVSTSKRSNANPTSTTRVFPLKILIIMEAGPTTE